MLVVGLLAILVAKAATLEDASEVQWVATQSWIFGPVELQIERKLESSKAKRQEWWS